MVIDQAKEIIVAERMQQLEDTVELFQERIAELEFAQEDRGWERLSGDSTLEFSKGHLDKIVARSRLYYLHNPLINRAVSLQADYVFAQGVSIQATDTDINNVIQAFLDDVQNIREITGHQARLMKEQTLMHDGNVFLVLFTDQQNTGKVQIRSVLVDEIVDIITNPDDANEIWFYKRSWTSKSVSEAGISSVLKIAYYPDIYYLPRTTNKIRSFKDGPVLWDAPVYHVKVGGLPKSRYGVPEVFPALDWAQAHKNFLQDWVTIVRSYAQFAWKFTVPGGRNSIAASKTRLSTTVTAAGTGSAVERNAPSLPGSTFITNKDGATMEPFKTQGATTNAQDGREIRMMVAAALGIPDTFFGDVDVGNLATARTLDRPTELKYRSRQTMWQEVFKTIIEHVIKWAAIAPKGPLKGKLNFTVDKQGVLTLSEENTSKKHIEIVFPPILEHSITDRIEAVANAVTLNGRKFAVDSPELAKLTIRLMLQALGQSDVDELIKKIFTDIDNQDIIPDDNDDNGVSKNGDPRATGTKPSGTQSDDRQVYP